MSELRRRIFGGGSTPDDSSAATSRESSPAPAPGRTNEEDGGDFKIIPKQKLEKLKKEVKAVQGKGHKRRNFWVFALGGVFGILLAGFFASSNGSLDQLVNMAGMKDMNLDSLLDILPAGVIRDVQNLQVCPTQFVLCFLS